jgi:hypothetical protein
MANVLGELFQSIADAIRGKTGETGTMKPIDFPSAIASIVTGSGGGGGGGSSADVRYVTFMNGTEVLYKKPVAVGDDCVDVLQKGLIETPTKESTVQYNYTFYGWGASDNGAADANILKNITEDKTVYAIYTSTLRMYTITYLDDDGVTVLHTEQVEYGKKPSYVPNDGRVFAGWIPAVTAVRGDATYTAQFNDAISVLDGYSWAAISEISAAGTGENYFSIGEMKRVTLNGTMGRVALNNTYCVYILGFNHNSEIEGTGIQFGTFKDMDGKDICLVDSSYGTTIKDGTKAFNINHNNYPSYGGWKRCDMRYDILGSTDVAPQGYGATAVEGQVGYDPTSTCATNPVAGTLMSCLPADLRAVMKPITKYTDNGDGGGTEANVTASVEYLPLMSFFELTASQGGSVNNAERKYQQQYAYFAKGKSKVKNQHSNVASAANWWLRTISASANPTSFYHALAAPTSTNNTSSNGAHWSYGVAPVFMV